MVSPALVGRTAELARLAAAVAAPPALVVIDGEAGVGKTRLVTELGERSELAGRALLTGRCHRIREPFPLGPVLEAIRTVGPRLADAPLPPVAGALRPLLPEVADLLPAAPDGLGDRAADRHRVFRALIGVLGVIGPAVLVLEDLQWVDDQTVDWLAYLLSEPPPDVAVVVTYRGDEAEPWVRSLPACLPSTAGRAEIRLQPLDAEQTGALAAAIVGADRVSHEFAGFLHERTSGLPLAIEEMLALLRERGTLVQRDGGWARRTLAELDVPAGIREPVLERVGRLSADARRLVTAAAVLQVPTSTDVLLATAQTDDLAGLVDALESGVLAEQATGVTGFRHLLAAQAVYDEISGPQRRMLHARAADALAAAEPTPLGQLAHHLRLAGRTDEWGDTAERAALHAVELGHDDEAVRILEQVLAEAPLEPARRGRLAIRLGQAAIDALRAPDVVPLLTDVLDESELPPTLRGELRFQVGMLRHDIGADPLHVRELLVDAIDDLKDRPDLRAWAMVVLGIPTHETVRLEEHLAWLHRALQVVPEVEDPALKAFLRAKVAMVLAPVGDPRWRVLTEQIEVEIGPVPSGRREVNAYLSVGSEACYAGHHDDAQRLLSAALEGAVAGENRRLELTARSALTLLRFSRGDWSGLTADTELLIDELAQHPRARIDAQIVAGCLALAGGELERAAERLPAAVDLCLELGAFDVLPVAAGALIRMERARGGDATAFARRMSETLNAKGVWATDARGIPAVAAALADAANGEARAFISHCADALARSDAPLARASLHHGWGFVHRASSALPAAATDFLAAARTYRRASARYDAALAEEDAAEALLAAGDLDGPPLLMSALATFRDLGASWDAGRAAQLAREHRVPVPAQHRGGRRAYGTELSPREHEVATLVASGRRNKEVAAELFLSVNTVARHVSAAMRKLDVRSRTELAHRLASDDRGPSKIGKNRA